MLQVSRGLSTINLDSKRFTRTLDRVLGQIIREAARKWLRSILTKGVPVETGMAKGSLAPLGRFLKNVGGLGISPTRPPYSNKLDGLHTVQRGEELSDFRIRDDKSNPLTFIYDFEWSTSVLHYYQKKYYKGKFLSGEESIPEANAVFDAFIVEALNRRLPNLVDYIRFENG